MRSLVAAVVLAVAVPAVSQPLTCPPVAAAAGKPCEAFHFHVAMFRPDTRGFVELSGINSFGSQAACDRARDAQFRRNTAVAEFFRTQRRQDWWQPDRFGQCHCDMTLETTSPNFLTPAQRMEQVRLADEIRQRVRERLLDADVPSDSELIRGMVPQPSPPAILGTPKLTGLPAAPAATAPQTNSPDDLRMTKTADAAAQPVASLDLPLAEIPLPGITPPAAAAPTTPETAAAAQSAQPAPAIAGEAAGATQSTMTASQSASAAPQPPPAPQSAQPSPQPPQPAAQPAAQPTPQPAVPAEPMPTAIVAAEEPEPPAADDVADAFISHESQRIQNVLKVSGSIGDETVKARVLEACTQRIQLLSNLRSLIIGSGNKSRIVAAAHNATTDEARLALIARLFGSDVAPHWAPREAENVVFDAGVADPEKVLRDTTAPTLDRKHALYALLATTSPTEQQQLWLTGVIEGFLK